MDFMKVFDQTVREIKREVNLKVLKVPEIEQKVLDATDNEPWGPHGSALAEIAQATKKFTECQMVMNVLWTRLGETGKDWRYVYKALAVIEYLIANGADRAVDDIIEHTFQISSLAGFEYVEPNGKDVGINVRKKAENIVNLLNNKDKIEEVRKKAATTREKYVGLSSTGISYKSNSTSFSGGSSQSNNKYGGFSGRYDSDNYGGKDEDKFGEDRFEKFVPKSRQGATTEKKTTQHTSKGEGQSSAGPLKSSSQIKSDDYSSISHATVDDQIDDDDDFNPRGTSTAKPAAGLSQQVDLFGDSLIGDLLDTAPTAAPHKTSGLDDKSSDADLFADADFVSAAPHVASGGNPRPQVNADLFAAQPASSAATLDFFASPDPIVGPETKSESSGPSNMSFVDPFAAVPLDNFDGSDMFGGFTSQTGQASQEPNESTLNNGARSESNNKSVQEPKAPGKKDGFQVKSGIWADSLSRGLIDLNIAAPKKVNLAGIGIVGSLSDGTDDNQKGPSTSYYMGTSMNMGSGYGTTSFNPTTPASDDFFSSYTSSQHQFGGFQK
ncbi:clathrin interactor EPSIN 1-like [Silene latifolia]|uniref:clathrin interactor EPSIN 1-like n=1 Tax=Silene latifolia TaxID=37657 RepID=UPI003D77FE10